MASSRWGGADPVHRGAVRLSGRLPGPHVRDWLGIRKGPPPACKGPPKEPGAVYSPAWPAAAPGRWRAEPTDPNPRDELIGAAIGRRVYLPNGFGPVGPVRTMTVFDTASGRYLPSTPTPVTVHHPVVVGHRGALYLAGGWENRRATRRMWTFSPKTGRWRELAPMRVPRAAAAGAVIGDRLYVAGGVLAPFRGHEANPVRSMEVYDFRTGRWQAGPQMPTARHHAGAAALGGRLYVVGGRAGKLFALAQFESFDPRRGTWTSLPPLPLGVGALAAVATEREVVAISGGNDREGWVTPATWAFDPHRGAWRRLSDLRLARHRMAGAVVGDRIYVFGGFYCPGSGRTGTAESLRVGY